MSPKKLSLTLTLGIIVGIMPFMLVGTYLLLVLAIIFRLNVPIIQLINHAAIAGKIVLFVPFLKLGQLIFNSSEIPFELSEILGHLRVEFWETFSTVWQVSLSGLIAWFIISIPIGYIIYRTSILFFTRKQNKPALNIA